MSGGVEYTIDELARAAGTTVRSVRVYHERGVLPPPQVKGRTGYYSPEHLQRVHTISRLLDRGIKLNGIKELLAALDRGDDLGDVLGVGETDAPATAAPSDSISATDLQERFADVPNGLARVVAAGIYEPVDAMTYRVADRLLAGFVEQLTAVGLPAEAVLGELERMRADCDRIARRTVDLLHREAWDPYRRSERTPADLVELSEQVRVARTLPGQVAAGLVTQLIDRELGHDVELSELLNKM